MTLKSLSASALAIALLASTSLAQRGGRLDEDDYLNGKNTLRAFQTAGQAAAASTVKLLRRGKTFALGTIISSDGYLVTKATELADKDGVLPDLERRDGQDTAVVVQVQTPAGEKLMGELIGYERIDDVAVIKVTADNLQPVAWTSSTGLFQGQWVAAMGRQLKSLNTGVISANRRQIDRRGGVLGVRLDPYDDADEIGVGLNQVQPNSPAQRAGFLPGDLIIEIEDREIRSRRQLSRQIGDLDPGEKIRITIQRGPQRIGTEIILGSPSKIFDMFDRNQQMSGKTSVRKFGFTEALQHELPLPPDAMGGPLVDLKGNTVGINIARADRVTTFALPAELVQDIARRIIEDAAARKPAKE